MTVSQQKVWRKIKSMCPDACYEEYDTGCYSCRVRGVVGEVAARFPHPKYGVCVVPLDDGLVDIQW